MQKGEIMQSNWRVPQEQDSDRELEEFDGVLRRNNKMVILDYTHGKVVIVGFDSMSEDGEEFFEEYCDNNGLHHPDCHYMCFSGNIEIR